MSNNNGKENNIEKIYLKEKVYSCIIPSCSRHNHCNLISLHLLARKMSQVGATNKSSGDQKSQICTTDKIPGEEKSQAGTIDKSFFEPESQMETTDKSSEQESLTDTTEYSSSETGLQVGTKNKSLANEKSQMKAVDMYLGQPQLLVSTTDNSFGEENSQVNSTDKSSGEPESQTSNTDRSGEQELQAGTIGMFSGEPESHAGITDKSQVNAKNKSSQMGTADNSGQYELQAGTTSLSLGEPESHASTMNMSQLNTKDKSPGESGEPESQTGTAVGTLGEPESQMGTAVGTLGEPESQTGTAVGTLGEPESQTGTAVWTLGEPEPQTGTAVWTLGEPESQTGTAVGSLGEPESHTSTMDKSQVNAKDKSSGEKAWQTSTTDVSGEQASQTGPTIRPRKKQLTHPTAEPKSPPISEKCVIEEKRTTRYYWLIGGFTVLTVVVVLLNSLYSWKGQPPVHHDSVLDIFFKEFASLKKDFPGQNEGLWFRSEKLLQKHLNMSHPSAPSILILTAAQDGERTLHCVSKRLAKSYADSLRSSWVMVNGPSKSSFDSVTSKMLIDNKLSSGFQSNGRSAVLYRLETLPPGSLLILYKYCDHENAAFKNVALVLTVLLEEQSLETDLSFTEVEEKVKDFLWERFANSKVSAHNEMDVDKLSGVWSRISHVVLPVLPVGSIESGSCPGIDD